MPDEKIKPTDIEKLTFEQAVQTLREIVEKVESGQVDLEQSIQQYEVGCKLILHCRAILDRAERRIEVLSKDLDGRLQGKPVNEQLEPDD